MVQSTEQPSRPWRELFGVHPAAQMFPPLSHTELEALAADIKERGMLVPVIMRRHDGPAGPGVPEYDVVDGRSRLDALQLAGLPLFVTDDGKPVPNFPMVVLGDDVDPYAVSISTNLKRRHLTLADRREAVAKYLAIRHDQSDRQIGAMFGLDHKTVGIIREKGVASGEFPQTDRTIGADGRSRRVKRTPRKTPTKMQQLVLDDFAEMDPTTRGQELAELSSEEREALFRLLPAVEHAEWQVEWAATVNAQALAEREMVAAAAQGDLGAEMHPRGATTRAAALEQTTETRRADAPAEPGTYRFSDPQLDLSPEAVEDTAKRFVEHHGPDDTVRFIKAVIALLAEAQLDLINDDVNGTWVDQIYSACLDILQPQEPPSEATVTPAEDDEEDDDHPLGRIIRGKPRKRKAMRRGWKRRPEEPVKTAPTPEPQPQPDPQPVPKEPGENVEPKAPGTAVVPAYQPRLDEHGRLSLSDRLPPLLELPPERPRPRRRSRVERTFTTVAAEAKQAGMTTDEYVAKRVAEDKAKAERAAAKQKRELETPFFRVQDEPEPPPAPNPPMKRPQE